MNLLKLHKHFQMYHLLVSFVIKCLLVDLILKRVSKQLLSFIP